MAAAHQIIGEGTYGCVAKPSLTCKGITVNYKNKVSKIMLEKYAVLEYNEMKHITSIPNIDKYIVSLPDLCVPVANATFKKMLTGCENEKFIKTPYEDFRLLIYEDGGVSLKQFSTELLPLLDRKNIHIFLTKIHHLLEGLCFFNLHDIVHHDIKSRNIVYNIDTNVIKFIDFGLVKMRSMMIRESSISKNAMAQQWDNFPPEYDLANKSEYDRKYRGTLNYPEFIQRVATTFDAYSFGRMMKPMLTTIRKYLSDPGDLDGLKELYSFFDKLGNKNIDTRDYDIFKFPEEYKKILQSHNIWNVNKGSASVSSINKQSQLSKITDMSTIEMSSLKAVLSNRKPCPDTKERNPVTKRCVNKCKNGYYRNSSFQCRKTRKSQKSNSPQKSKSQCPDDKERNPKTNRCVKKCKPGFVRNDLFLCRRPPK